MAQPVGPLIDTVLQRVFDPAGVGTSRAAVRDLLSRAQQIVNAAADAVVVNQSMTVPPDLQVFNFERIAPANDVLRIKAVRDGVRDLSRIEFERLKAIDIHWFGRTGSRFQTFAVLGRRILIVHPQRPVAGTVNVVYTQQLPRLNVESDLVALPDDLIPTLTKLGEMLVLLKQRDLAQLAPLIENFGREITGLRREAA